MPTCSETYGQGWVGEYPSCTFDAGTSQLEDPYQATGDTRPGEVSGEFRGSVSSLNYGKYFGGTTFSDNKYKKFFDPYDIKEEEMLGRHAATDVGQLKEAWGLESQQLGQQYQQQIGGLFEQAGTGMMDLMSSWGGGGQTMTGRKGRQRRDIGRAAEREAGGYGIGLSQARDTGQLELHQGTTDIYQGLEKDIYGAREDWLKAQRANLNTLLGMDIYTGTDTGGGNSTAPTGRRGYTECIDAGGTKESCSEEFSDPLGVCPEGFSEAECETATQTYTPEPSSNVSGTGDDLEDPSSGGYGQSRGSGNCVNGQIMYGPNAGQPC